MICGYRVAGYSFAVYFIQLVAATRTYDSIESKSSHVTEIVDFLSEILLSREKLSQTLRD